MLVPAMKLYISRSLKYDITNINTYSGYDDADILKIEFKDIQELLHFRETLKQTKISYKITIQEPKIIYCIFERSTDNYTYTLK